MNKTMLAVLLADRTDMSVKQASDVVDQLVQIIQTSINNGLPVTLRGFGTFSLRRRRSRMVGNAHLQQSHRIPEAVVPVFRPSRKLRKELR